jgi:hypothetical protein
MARRGAARLGALIFTSLNPAIPAQNRRKDQRGVLAGRIEADLVAFRSPVFD